VIQFKSDSMKALLPFLLILSLTASAQITTPVLKAGFGVDAELRSNFYNNFVQSGNDDWFPYPNSSGTGKYVIDTTGAAAIVAGYATDASPWPRRMASFFRPMSVPQFSIVNNRLWLDALFVRDYHATDTTVFVSANKNGDSPENWTGGVQPVPDKNDILDMMMHVRRAGPNTTDSLWLFGGLSLDNTTGQRYFDFEMYQTDIYYDRASGNWYGYGADAGHTSWQFDAAGNVTRPGDIIFSAEYQNSALTNIEARIWVDRSALSITPAGFSWSGQFDGAYSGCQYGYASILPNTTGAFYTGLGSGTNTWAGPFQVVLVSNAVATNYTKDQFMEFSVNLTKLGLDPVTTFGTDVCGTPFNRLVVKTRTSASFTSSLKDFVAPTDLFLAPRADAIADVPMYCGVVSSSNLQVINPSLSSVYSWSTPDGHIVGTSSGPNITVDSPGTYIVTQRLSAACNPYAYDTLSIVYDASCVPMSDRIVGLSGNIKFKTATINWTTRANKETEYFEVQRSENGRDFYTVGKVLTVPPNFEQDYSFKDNLAGMGTETVYYRLRIKMTVGQVVYSGILRLGLGQDQKNINVYPNPVKDVLQLSVPSAKIQEATVSVYNASGALLKTAKFGLKEGSNIVQMDASAWSPGTYMVSISIASQMVWEKFVVAPTAYNK
jgi:hypothetical protein